MTVKVIVKVTVKVKDLCAVERMLPRMLLRERTVVLWVSNLLYQSSDRVLFTLDLKLRHF